VIRSPKNSDRLPITLGVSRSRCFNQLFDALEVSWDKTTETSIVAVQKTFGLAQSWTDQITGLVFL
jgi:hypothetical protein